MAHLQTKKLINHVESCIDECLQGLVSVNSGLQILNGHRVVIRRDVENLKQSGKIALLSGGGSGHEPAHAGFIGSGMLTGAIAGAVFTSPPPSSILAAIRKVGKSNPGGVLLIVKNYTGDRLNFGLAAERAKAEGIPVEMLVVGEDCALTSSDKSAGRRGLCGTIFIHKIAGALAEAGQPMSQIMNICKQAASSMGTIGLSLSPCSVPGSGPSFQLGADEMELGLGIHGEAGVRRLKVLNVKEAVKLMIDHLTDPESATHLNIPKGSSLALMVNNLGGTSVLELNVVAHTAISDLGNRGFHVDRAYCGSFMTSLEMAGVSLTLLILDNTLKQCLDSQTSAPGWIKPLLAAGERDRHTPDKMECEETSAFTDEMIGLTVSPEIAAMLSQAIAQICESLIQCETQLNKLDTQSGDGDCGTTLKRGILAIQESQSSLPVGEPHKLMLALANIVEQAMGGSSGAFYSLLLSAAARSLSTDVSVKGWCQALGDGVKAISHYGGAEPGDRTMLDSLHAAHITLLEALQHTDAMTAFKEAVQAAEKAAQDTAHMKARAGRASYVSAEHLTQADPGAYAVAVWMKAAYDACKMASK